jgi:hypothetical protein
MLMATPIGTEYSEAKKYIDHRFPRVLENCGDRDRKQPKVVYVTYGTYVEPGNFPFANVVNVSWYFDPNGRLEKITVTRYMDGP